MFTISNETDYTKINVQGKLKHKDYIDVYFLNQMKFQKKEKLKHLLK